MSERPGHPNSPPTPRPPDPGQPEKTKMPLGIKILIAVAAVLGVLVTVFAGFQSSGPAGGHSVVYKIDTGVPGGTGSGMITMQTPSGTSQLNSPLPTQLGDDGFQRGDFLYVSVQGGDATTSVACHILVDGKIVSENVAVGQYTIATCQATAPW